MIVFNLSTYPELQKTAHAIAIPYAHLCVQQNSALGVLDCCHLIRVRRVVAAVLRNTCEIKPDATVPYTIHERVPRQHLGDDSVSAHVSYQISPNQKRGRQRWRRKQKPQPKERGPPVTLQRVLPLGSSAFSSPGEAHGSRICLENLRDMTQLKRCTRERIPTRAFSGIAVDAWNPASCLWSQFQLLRSGGVVLCEMGNADPIRQFRPRQGWQTPPA